jgi:mandelate racemase family protein
MKITKVDVMLINPKAEDNKPWTPVGIRVYTDAGIYGDGEAAMAYGSISRGAYGAVIDFSEKIIGKDPLDTEVIWEDLYKSTFWAQNGGPVTFGAISAIDVALWDIKAKYFRVPLYKLLGGKQRDKLRCYASQLQFGWGPVRVGLTTAQEYADIAKKAVAEGYSAVKVDFFTFDRDGSRFNHEQMTRLLPAYYVNLVEERVAAVREAIGPDVDLIMENHSNIDAQGAVQLANVVEKYNIFMLEEPCTPSPDVNKFVHDHITIPVSQGERIYTRWQYKQYFQDGSIQMIQPDIGNCGGITETKKVCDMAHAYDIGVQIHVCSSPILTAAALHLESVLPNFTIHEHHVYNLHNYNKQLCIHDYQPEHGYFSIPEIPGIGNEWSEYAFTHCQLTTVE